MKKVAEKLSEGKKVYKALREAMAPPRSKAKVKSKCSLVRKEGADS